MSSHRRRIYLTIIAVGLVLVAIDRLYIQDDSAALGPQNASAHARSPVAAGEATAKETSFARIWVPPVSLEVPQAWKELAEQADAMLRQPFSADRPGRAAGLVDATIHEESETEAPGAFADRHRLEAILTSRSKPLAIIDGQVVTEGERIEGYVIEEIDRWSVRLRGADETVMLILPSETLGAPRDAAPCDVHQRVACPLCR
jgi:hypothetical protein